MAYHEFTLENVGELLGLTVESADLFSEVEPRALSDLVRGSLEFGSPLAIINRTEKAKSEFIIAPLMLEWVRQLAGQISLFSGIEFNVDRSRGLNGNCDYLVSKGRQTLLLTTPAIAIVESKNDYLASGLGQCMAEMVAAQVYNEVKNTPRPMIYGVVTTGSEWQFLRLQGQMVTVDERVYYLVEPGKILGILVHLATHL